MHVVALLVWFVVALAAGATGLVAGLRPPMPQVLIFALTALTVVVALGVPPIRARVAALPVEALVAVHLGRFVGAYFLVLYGRGALPYDFAVPGGVGDMAVALFAAVLLVFDQPLRARPGLTRMWNTLGLIDILFVVLTAARLTRADPASMAPLLHLPLSLLPTFYVPLVIATHVLIFMRLRQ